MTVKSSSSLPKSVFLDTNIYILGALDLNSDESKILSLLVSDENSDEQTRVIFSQELIDQILRVGKRLQNKDWSSGLLIRLWQQLKVDFIFVEDQDIQAIADAGIIPREDAGVYHVQIFNSYFSDSSNSYDHASFRINLKMFAPQILSWMKKLNFIV